MKAFSYTSTFFINHINIERFLPFLTGETGRAFNNFLTLKGYQSEDILTDTTYRIINHWSSLGLIEDASGEGKWRRFGLADIYWIYTILKLRKFGLSLDKIKIAKDSLFGNTYPHSEFNLNLFITSLILRAATMSIYFVVFEDGTTCPCFKDEYVEKISDITIDSHMVINFNTIFTKEDKQLDLALKQIKNYDFTEKEEKIIGLIRQGNYEKITITQENGEITLFEGTETISSKKRVIDIVKEHDYQYIELWEGNGKVSKIKRTVKKKVS